MARTSDVQVASCVLGDPLLAVGARVPEVAVGVQGDEEQVRHVGTVRQRNVEGRDFGAVERMEVCPLLGVPQVGVNAPAPPVYPGPVQPAGIDGARSTAVSHI